MSMEMKSYFLNHPADTRFGLETIHCSMGNWSDAIVMFLDYFYDTQYNKMQFKTSETASVSTSSPRSACRLAPGAACPPLASGQSDRFDESIEPTTSNRSATNPTSAIWKIGASPSTYH